MTEATPCNPTPSPAARREPGTTRARRDPITVFLLLAFGIGLPLLAIPAIAGIQFAPFLLGLVYLGLLVPALVASRMADGPGAVRRLLSRALMWRFGIVRWGVIVFAVPLLTVAVAAASGTLESPEGGWVDPITTYLFNTFIVGVLILNLWEETAWAGFAQTRFMARHGLLVASLLTALFFAAIHIPLQFEGNWSWSEVGVGWATLFVLAPFYRYLIGMHLLDTGGSILAAAVQHASWNEAGKLDGVSGDWQAAVAIVLLTLLLAAGRQIWRREKRPTGRGAEQAAAAGWITPAPSARRSREGRARTPEAMPERGTT